MDTNEKLTQLENEIKVLKNEVQAVLLDIREHLLSAENPFSAAKPVVVSQPVTTEHQDHPKEQQSLKEPNSTTTLPLGHEEKPADENQPYEITAVKTKNNGKKISESEWDDLEPAEHRETRDSRIETAPPPFETGNNKTGKQPPDLVAYASLASWVEESTKKIGQERTQALLEISEVAGYLPSNVKEILTKLTTIESVENSINPTAKDYFNSLVKISTLIGNNNDYNAALLLLLSQGDANG